MSFGRVVVLSCADPSDKMRTFQMFCELNRNLPWNGLELQIASFVILLLVPTANIQGITICESRTIYWVISTPHLWIISNFCPGPSAHPFGASRCSFKQLSYTFIDFDWVMAHYNRGIRSILQIRPFVERSRPYRCLTQIISALILLDHLTLNTSLDIQNVRIQREWRSTDVYGL